MRALLVVNPNATTASAAARTVLTSALSSQLDLTVVHTDRRGHATELAAAACRDGMDLVVALGGDGTLNEVVNGLLGPPAQHDGAPGARRPALAVVPGGSANVFAKALGISTDPIEATEQLLAAISCGHRRSLGLGHTEDRWFLLNAGLGWDAEVVRAVEEHRHNGKPATPLRYVWSAVRHYFSAKHHAPVLSAQIGDAAPVNGLHVVIVTNADPWTYWGNHPVRTNPGTSFSGGLGVFALQSLRWPTLARVVPQMLSRRGSPRAARLLREDDVPTVRVHCERPTALQLDGDYLGLHDNVAFSTVADAVQVLVQPNRENN